MILSIFFEKPKYTPYHRHHTTFTYITKEQNKADTKREENACKKDMCFVIVCVQPTKSFHENSSFHLCIYLLRRMPQE